MSNKAKFTQLEGQARERFNQLRRLLDAVRPIMLVFKHLPEHVQKNAVDYLEAEDIESLRKLVQDGY